MSRQSFTVVRHTTAAPELLYDLLADVPRWAEWAPMVTHASVVRPGSPDPTGAGTVRRVGGPPPFRVEEKVLEAVRGVRQCYTITRGVPVEDYRAEVRFEPQPDGSTLITWHGTFRPSVGLLGLPVRVFLRTAVTQLANGLVRAAERTSASDGQSG